MKKPPSFWPAYLSVAFIWFSIQFGGGFSSGRQLVEFFLQYGPVGLITPVISQFLVVFILYFSYSYALNNRLYDYREWANSFYHPYEKIMSNVFEAMYNIILLAATAVSLATAGSILNKSGLNYLLCTLIVAAIIFIFTIFGASLVRKSSTLVSLITIVSILVLFLPNIIHFWPQIVHNLSAGSASSASDPGAGLAKGLLYGCLQTTGLAAFLAHTEVFHNKSEIKRSLGLGLAINSIVITTAIVGVFAVYSAGMADDVLPTLTLAERGVLPSLMAPLISILVFSGSAFTGINLIFGNVSKIVRWLGRGESRELFNQNYRRRSILVSSSYITVAWLFAQLGLISLVKNVYTFNGFMGLTIIIIPILIHVAGERKNKAGAQQIRPAPSPAKSRSK